MSSADRSIGKTALGYLVVVAAAASLVFEQSPANEFVRTNAAISMYHRTTSAVWVGVVVFAVTVVIEFVAAFLITLGLHAQGGAVQRLKDRMIRKRAEKLVDLPGEQKRDSAGRRIGRFGADVAVALALGAGLVTLRRHVTEPNPTMAGDLRVSFRATMIVAVVSGMVGYLLGGGLANAHRVGLERPAELIVEYGINQWFWVSLLAIGYLIVLLVRLVKWVAKRLSAGPAGANAASPAPVPAQPPTAAAAPRTVAETSSAR